MTTKAADLLLVTTRADPASDSVAEVLARAGTKFFRLNTEEFPIAARSSVKFNGSNGDISWLSAEFAGSLDQVKCVWFRRHRLPLLPAGTVPAHAEYCLREAQWFIRGILLRLAETVPAAAWMSRPSDVQRAESKILQLQVAPTVGFACPETLISNDPNEVRAFFDDQGGHIVAKALRLGYFDYEHSQTAVYTTSLAASHLVDDDALSAAPVIYQQHLEKQCDIRVTVVDNTLFAAAIHSQAVASARVDWRRSDVELEHTVHALPLEIEEACIRLMRILHLKYGAIDLVLTPDDQYYFLEINPNGQWLWLEDKLGFKITDAIASWLQNRH